MINGTLKLAVPPGVGDVYWALTKLQALKQREKAQRVHLFIQRSAYDRSRDWAKMVDFVDSASTMHFRPPRTPTGIDRMRGVHYVLWPNTVVDRGDSLASWLPGLELDLSFPVKTESMGDERRVVIYPSSESINRAWLSSLDLDFWPFLVRFLTDAIGRVTIIGAAWDLPFYQRALQGRECGAEFLVGKTSLPQVADVIKKARVLVGVASGMTILANHFRTPCVALFPDAHHERFPYTWVAGDAPYKVFRNSNAPAAHELAAVVKEIAR